MLTGDQGAKAYLIHIVSVVLWAYSGAGNPEHWFAGWCLVIAVISIFFGYEWLEEQVNPEKEAGAKRYLVWLLAAGPLLAATAIVPAVDTPPNW